MFLDPWSSLCPRMRVQDIVAELLLVVNRLVSKQEKAGLPPLHHLLGDVLLAAHGIYRYPVKGGGKTYHRGDV